MLPKFYRFQAFNRSGATLSVDVWVARKKRVSGEATYGAEEQVVTDAALADAAAANSAWFDNTGAAAKWEGGDGLVSITGSAAGNTEFVDVFLQASTDGIKDPDDETGQLVATIKTNGTATVEASFEF